VRRDVEVRVEATDSKREQSEGGKRWDSFYPNHLKRGEIHHKTRLCTQPIQKMLSILFFSFLTGVNVFVYLEVYHESVMKQIRAFLALNSITKNWCSTLGLYLQMGRVYLRQRQNQCCKYIGHNRYQLNHVIGGKKYSIVLKVEPEDRIFQITDDDDTDVTEKVEPFVRGSVEPFSPMFLNSKTMKIHTNQGTIVTLQSPNSSVPFAPSFA
jgi:hypothetical protein